MWTDAVLQRCEAAEKSSGGATRLVTLPDAGHWVHIDAADELVAIMRKHWLAAASTPAR